jgi:hypothetical protein
MLQPETIQKNQAKPFSKVDSIVLGLVGLEILLVSMALVPAQLWGQLFHDSTNATINGPFPAPVAPLVTAAIYMLPTVIGFLSQNWQKAILYATLPAWIGLGAFLIAATFRVGAFYAVSADHVTANVSVLELFAALGAIGWLFRCIIKRGV